MIPVQNLEGERSAGHEGANVEVPARSVLSLNFHPTHLPSPAGRIRPRRWLPHRSHLPHRKRLVCFDSFHVACSESQQ